MISVFNYANTISNQSLTGVEIDSQKNLIYLFINMAITFAFGGISLKALLDDMQDWDQSLEHALWVEEKKHTKTL